MKSSASESKAFQSLKVDPKAKFPAGLGETGVPN